jgi:hypothetical protein
MSVKQSSTQRRQAANRAKAGNRAPISNPVAQPLSTATTVQGQPRTGYGAGPTRDRFTRPLDTTNEEVG